MEKDSESENYLLYLKQYISEEIITKLVIIFKYILRILSLIF